MNSADADSNSPSESCWTGRCGHSVSLRGKLASLTALAMLAVLFCYAVSAQAQTTTHPRGAFNDDDGSVHERALDALGSLGYLDGTECGNNRICPTRHLRRWELAVWLGRAITGTDPLPISETRFADVDTEHWWATHVERFADLGVTAGCKTQPLSYCPYSTVNRAQIASFLVQALDLPEAGLAGFIDTARSPHAANIDALAARNLTAGCSNPPLRFCPRDRVTRAQMATFIARAKGLSAVSGSLAAHAPQVALYTDAPALVHGAFDVTVRFSKHITSLTESDFISVNSTVSWISGNGSASGSGSRFVVRVTPDADGTVMLRLRAGAVVSLSGDENSISTPIIRVQRASPLPANTGFEVWNRWGVISEHRTEFSRTEPDMGFTGDVASCRAGTTSSAYRASIIQRINWYRQMAGLGTVQEDAAMSDGAQHTAVMMIAAKKLSHHPDTSWPCYTTLGADFAAKSNLGLGEEGVRSIDDYMQDSGDNNVSVGHRRWILYPQTQRMGTGNAQAADHSWWDADHWPANALAVFDDNLWAARPPVREARDFVAWPPAGYITAGQVWGRWSFSLPEANFDAATVAVADDVDRIPVEVIHRGGHFGEPSIVFAIEGDTHSSALPEPQGADRCFTVTISGVRERGKAEPSMFEYPVCLLAADVATDP